MTDYWVIPPKANAAFVAAMEDVLGVYTGHKIRRGLSFASAKRANSLSAGYPFTPDRAGKST